MSENNIPLLNAVETPQYPSQDFDTKVAHTRRSRQTAAAISISILTPSLIFGVQNYETLREIPPAIENYQNHEMPEEGEIIPSDTGCKEEDAYNWSRGARPEGSNPTSLEELMKIIEDLIYENIKDKDEAYQAVKNNSSAAAKFSEAAPEKFESSVPIFMPFRNYFDTTATSYESSVGLELNFLMHEGDVRYKIDPVALEQMIADITTTTFIDPETGEVTNIFANPKARRILECKNRQVFDEGMLDGRTVNFGVIADGNKGFEGNHVVTQSATEPYKPSLSSGLGTPDISLRFLDKVILPDHIALIAGKNRTLEPNQLLLNRRFLHELIHQIVSPDLSAVAKEYTQHERFVEYVVDEMIAYYTKHGALPQVIIIK